MSTPTSTPVGVGWRHMLATGATPRQIDTWTRNGHLRVHNDNPGSGHARQWADGEDLIAVTIVRLLRAGLTLPAAVRAARGHTHLAPGINLLILPPPPFGPSVPGTGWCTLRDGHTVTDTDIDSSLDTDLEQMAAAS